MTSIMEAKQRITSTNCRHPPRRPSDQSTHHRLRTAANKQQITVDEALRLSRRHAIVIPMTEMLAQPAQAASTDLLEGTQNWLNIGVQSYGLWAQSVLDSISNDDQTGLIAADDGQPRRRAFGHISIPGLSSFSFIHGTLVGGLMILLLALTTSAKQTDQQPQQEHGKQPHAQQQQPLAVASQQPDLNPEVEAALRRLLASPEVTATFHDPSVHSALQEVRGDVRSIAKYKNDPAVMQAFEKLLEIEDILERL